MAQRSQIVDLRRSYIPGDPNSIHQNLVNTSKEDGIEEQTLPIAPFEGYNFLPTSYGYRSYFGTSSKIDIASLTSRIQHCITYQLPNYKNRYIVLAEDGIWISQENKTWLHAKTHAYDIDMYEEWTYCFIENVLYMYQQGKSVIYKTSYDLSYVLSIQEITPNFLNMSGQMGIFKAGTRLGMWDSSNSISWSSTFDFSDFTPSLETLAGNSKFNSVVGRIVHIKSHSEGFLVYSTRSVVGASLNLNGNMLWDARELFSNIGVDHPHSICSGASEAEHYVYTTAGILRIGKYSPAAGKYELEWLFPEVYDFVRESRDPVLLTCIHKRFLCFTLFSDDYLTGAVTYTALIIDPSLTTLTLAAGYWEEDINVLPDQIDGNMLRTIVEQFLAGNFPVITENC